MWVRIDDDIVEKFIGSNPFGHHDGEERLKIRLREALKDRNVEPRLRGKELHKKFIQSLNEAGGGEFNAEAMWPTLNGAQMQGWDNLAQEIATALAANGRELARREMQITEALELIRADGKLAGVDIDIVQRILERE